MDGFTPEEMEKLKSRPCFTLYYDKIIPAVECLNGDELKEFMQFVIAYSRGEDTATDNMTPAAALAATMIRQSLDYSASRYIEMCKRNKDNRNKARQSGKRSRVVTSGHNSKQDATTGTDKRING